MILEVDCGNSSVKWRVISGSEGLLVAQGMALQLVDLIRELADQNVQSISRCRLVSVRGDAETEEMVTLISAAFKVDVAKACAAAKTAGVANGYYDPQRLGLDRWLAVIAAYEMCQGACLVIALGTAITVDLVDHDGVHLGGYIVPGTALLRGQLLAHTRRIHYSPAEIEAALAANTPGKSTAEGVERGCLMMVRSYVASQIAFAGDQLGEDFTVLVTGGDAALVADLPGVKCVSDLVFRGLAIACP